VVHDSAAEDIAQEAYLAAVARSIGSTGTSAARSATGRTRGLVLSVALCYGQCVPGKRRSTLMTIALHLLSKSSRLFV